MSTERATDTGFTDNDHPIELSYQHANPMAGNESVLLRFGYEGHDGDACLLIDAGADVSPDRLLRPEDRLIGVCLTHVHLDHYQSLPACLREGVSVYTSAETMAMAGDVLDVASEHYAVTDRGGVADALVCVDGWRTICPGVRLHPLPAGHAPGAIGFLVRFNDGEDHHDIVVTGDFTRTDCAGFPGFQTDLGSDIELLFLTAATTSAPGNVLTDALGDALECAVAGGRTLVTAGGLMGVHFATLVAAANAELDVSVPIRLVGQAAKLYDVLEYDHDVVETVPVFDDPRTCLTPGAITVAGPEVPIDDSSEHLYGELKDDADAALVQLITSGTTPVRKGGCVTTHYELSMHPTESTLRSVVEDLEPLQTVLTHCQGTDKYNDLPTCVWSPGDDDVYDLYKDNSWCPPPWMSSVRRRDTSKTNRLGALAGDVFADLPLPSTDRASLPKLAAEGVDIDQLADRLTDQTDTTASLDDAANTHDSSDDSVRDDPITTSTPDLDSMNDIDTSDDSTGSELYRTTGPEVDTDSPADFEEPLPSLNNTISARVRRCVLYDNDDSNDNETTPVIDDKGDSTVDNITDDPTKTNTDTAPDITDGNTESDTTSETDNTPDMDSTTSDEDIVDTATPLKVELDPILAALLERTRATTDDDRPLGTLVADAVEAYLNAVLREELTPAATTTTVNVTVNGLLDETLTAAIDEAGINDLNAAVREHLATTIVDNVQTTVTTDLGRCASLLHAVHETHDAFETRTDVINAAVERFLEIRY